MFFHLLGWGMNACLNYSGKNTMRSWLLTLFQETMFYNALVANKAVQKKQGAEYLLLKRE